MERFALTGCCKTPSWRSAASPGSEQVPHGSRKGRELPFRRHIHATISRPLQLCSSLLRNLSIAPLFLAIGLFASLVGVRLAQAQQSDLDVALAAEEARVAAVAKAMQSAVMVFEPGGKGGGSGVLVTSDGYALTNFHVVKPCGEFMKCGLADGRVYDAVIVGIDPVGDVAMIKLFGRDDFVPAERADSDQVRVGDWCFAIGNPFLLATDLQPTLSYGIVSGVHRYQYPAGTLLEYADCIQTDAAINPGNSGGPLFDAQGRLIGVNGRGSFEKRGRVNVGVGYAISMNQIEKFMGGLMSGRILDHATLGATVSEADDGRVVVTNILESSDAYRRGLRYGDEIVSLGGRSIRSPNAFKNVLGIYPRGWSVPLSFRRDGTRFDVRVKLAGVHDPTELLAKVQGAPGAPPAGPPGDKPPEGEKPPGEIPTPKPGERPSGDKPDHEGPGHEGHAHGASPPPPEVMAQYEERFGYANYYFNRTHQARLEGALARQFPPGSAGAVWTLTGQVEGQGDFRFVLDDAAVSLALPAGETKIDLAQPLETQLGPEGSGGLGLALAMTRRLATEGPAKFGDLHYEGTAPDPTGSIVADVLVGTFDVLEAWFYFHPESGQLVAVELYPDAHVDPCTLLFGEREESEGRTLPTLMEVRHGDRVFGLFRIDSFAFEAKEAS